MIYLLIQLKKIKLKSEEKMDIIKEINLLFTNQKDTFSILSNLFEEERQLENKIHIFRVLHMAGQYQRLITDGSLARNNIFSINLDLFFYKRNKISSWEIKDINGVTLSKENIDKDIYEKLSNWNNGISAKKTQGWDEINLIFNESFREKFIDCMLSSELNSILQATKIFFELEQEMKVNNSQKTNKKKI